MKFMPDNPTPEMREAALKALSNSTVKNPKAAAWDAIVAYRAMRDAAPTADLCDECAAVNENLSTEGGE